MPRIDNQIDTTTGTLKLRAMFANPDELLYPNQFVNARLLVNTHAGHRPRAGAGGAARRARARSSMSSMPNNTVSVRPIKLGPTDGGYEAVLSGLQPGERVVTDGTDRLRDGATVTVPAAAPKAAPARRAAGQAAPTGQARPAGPGGQPARQAGSPGAARHHGPARTMTAPLGARIGASARRSAQ